MRIRGPGVSLCVPSKWQKRISIQWNLCNSVNSTPASGSWNFYSIIMYHFLFRPMRIKFIFDVVYWWSMHHLCWQINASTFFLRFLFLSLASFAFEYHTEHMSGAKNEAVERERSGTKRGWQKQLSGSGTLNWLKADPQSRFERRGVTLLSSSHLHALNSNKVLESSRPSSW